MPDGHPPEAPTTPPPGLGPDVQSIIEWVQERWALLAGLAVLLLVVWLAWREPQSETGRYVLVKDNVPCQANDEGEARRWCYLVLDTQTGSLEERVRKTRPHGRR